MKEREHQIELYLTYEKLHTENQKMIFEEYYFEDLSLTEIAENMKMSKSYVGKTLQTISEKLEYYEETLQINYKNNLIVKALETKNYKEKIKKIISG